MISLGRTRAELLAEIDAPNLPGDPLSDLTDLHAASEDAYVRVCGRARDELFPLLKIALSERFAAAPRLQVIRDLLLPLRNILGNAYKHGNGCDPAKVISVEIVLTAKGALIAVTDEGSGFDVALTFRRFQGQESYFANYGVGFRNLHRAISMVSYENGGRTVLLCFRPTIQNHDRALNSHALPKVPGAEWIQKSLSAEVPEFGKDGAKIESYRVYPACGCAGDDCGNRYVLRLAGRNGRPAETRILTGRLHPTEAAAASDFEAATKLHDARISIKLRIPRPVALLAVEPRLVLSSCRQLPVVGRRAYPMRAKVTMHALLGCRRLSCPAGELILVHPSVEVSLLEVKEGSKMKNRSAEVCVAHWMRSRVKRSRPAQ